MNIIYKNVIGVNSLFMRQKIAKNSSKLKNFFNFEVHSYCIESVIIFQIRILLNKLFFILLCTGLTGLLLFDLGFAFDVVLC